MAAYLDLRSTLIPPCQGHKWLVRQHLLARVSFLLSTCSGLRTNSHSYLRAIANVPATDSSWTLDPRVEITKIFDKQGTPRGVGNQVSCEFNLLYRFHSAVSNRDSKWTKEFFAGMFPGEDPLSLSLPKLLQGIGKFEREIPDDPSIRTFGGLKRNDKGVFNDDELVQILKESIEDPGGIALPIAPLD